MYEQFTHEKKSVYSLFLFSKNKNISEKSYLNFNVGYPKCMLEKQEKKKRKEKNRIMS